MEHPSVQAFMAEAQRRNPNEPEFLQAVEEVAETVIPFIESNPRYQGHALLERMIEPERVIQFRVPWTDGRAVHAKPVLLTFREMFSLHRSAGLQPIQLGFR